MSVRPRNHDEERLTFLVRAGEIFHQSLDVEATLSNVAWLAVESFADVCLFDLLDERSARLFVTAAAYRDPAAAEILAGVASILYVEEWRVHPVVQVTHTGTPFFAPSLDDESIRAHAASRHHERYMRALHYRSKIVVPVTTQNQIFGALTFVRTGDAECFDEGDLSFAIELGRRAGQAVANAKQFHRERNVAETLQRAFLPQTFPRRAGLELSAFYRPGSSEADIGGDWYDAFESGGKIVLTIGDVTGKGVDAARFMILMRQAIRIAALETSDPVHIADICNRLLLAEEGDRLASAFIGVLEPDSRALTYVSAGHAPPYLRLGDGTLQRLESPSPPAGAVRDAHFESFTQVIPDGTMLVLYTDGVIEATRDVLAGEQMLCDVLRSDALPHVVNTAEFIERAIAEADPHDDIAIMVVKVGGREFHWQFQAADSRAAYAMRHEFFQQLRQLCNGACEDEIGACGVIFAELVGNAVRHAPGALDISLEVSEGRVVLHVIDEGQGFSYDPRLPADVWAESGRGLFLVSHLARDVRVDRIPGRGSHVSVTLPIDVKGSAASSADTPRAYTRRTGDIPLQLQSAHP